MEELARVTAVTAGINELALLAHQVSAVSCPASAPASASVTTALRAGFEHVLCRQLLSVMLRELLGKQLPFEQPSGFAAAVLKALRAAALFPEFEEGGAVDGVYAGLEQVDGKEGGGGAGFIARLELLEALVAELRANRLLEHQRYARSSAVIGGETVKGQRGEGHQQPLAAADRYAEAIARINASAREEVLVPGAAKPAEAADTLVTWLTTRCAATGTPIALLRPMVTKSSLDAAARAKLNAADAVLREEYALRRRALLQRFRMTLATFEDAECEVADKATLRALTALAAARVGVAESPEISLEGLFNVPALELVSAFAKTSQRAASFKLRNTLIAQVPDRGGRVNTFDFDTKVDVARRRADADLRAKYKPAAEQREHQRSAAGRGSGGGRSGGRGGGRGASSSSTQRNADAPAHVDPSIPPTVAAAIAAQSAAQQQQQQRSRGRGRGRGAGGGGGGGGAFAEVDIDSVRGRGGKWGSRGGA